MEERRPSLKACLYLLWQASLLVISVLLWPWTRKDRSNCALHGIDRLYHEGGFLVFTKSKYGSWCHAYWVNAEATERLEFIPVKNKRKRWVPPVLFKGRSKITLSKGLK